MNTPKKWNLELSAKVTVILAFVPIAYNMIYNLLTTGKVSPEQYSVQFALLLLAIALIFQSLINRFRGLSDEISGNMAQTIKDDITEIVGNIKKDIEDFKKKLASGIVQHEDQTYRALIYHERKGEILNGFSGEQQSSRNILLSNQTINLIFRGIKNSNERLLKEIGRNSSERFADELVNDIRRRASESQKKGKGVSNDLHDWIRFWIDFDSDAGFGRFVIDSNVEKWKKEKTIILQYSFLAEKYRERETRICDFMSGYIEGILNAFPRDVLQPYGLVRQEIIVTHDVMDRTQCMCAGRSPDEGCVFFIKS